MVLDVCFDPSLGLRLKAWTYPNNDNKTPFYSIMYLEKSFLDISDSVQDLMSMTSNLLTQGSTIVISMFVSSLILPGKTLLEQD